MREDIQALRAFAVVAVLLFHVDLPFVQGGYLGVDIFFVISGFVITGLILRDLRAGEFSFRTFLVRRVSRILPASTVTIALTFLVGVFVMTSYDLRYLGASSVVALTSVSNIHFWLESGYFDRASHLKPLLHTWSLAVEEQFYLFWPVAMIFAFNRHILGAMIAGAGILSLFAAELALRAQPEAAFFLMPFRVFEFCAGAILHFLPASRRAWPFYPGVAIMVASVILLDSSHPMPGLVSLVPVAGAVLCLVSGASLGWRFPSWIVGIGNASYSIYLAHWPAIVFYRYEYGSNLEVPEQSFLLLISLTLGLLLHRFVERPMRPIEFWQSRSPRIASAVFVAGLGTATSTAWAGDGWSWRLPSDLRETMSKVSAMPQQWFEFFEESNQSEFGAQGKKVLIIGDSHGQDLRNALYQSGADNIVRLNIDYRCQPVIGTRPIESGNATLVVKNEATAIACEAGARRIFQHPLIGAADIVILSARWKEWSLGRLPAAIALLRTQTESPILVFGPQAEFEPPVPRLVERHGSLTGLDSMAAESELKLPRAVSSELKAVMKQTDAIYVDKFDILCGASSCPLVVPGSEKLFIWDYGHWTIEGAKYFGQQLVNHPVLSPLLFHAIPAPAKSDGAGGKQPSRSP